MPLVDMPLKELKTYKGVNPKPADFDEYWNRAIKEMESTDPNVELVKSDFQASLVDCYDMYYDGTRIGRVYAKLLVPKNISGKAPAVLHFHGYTGSSSEWMSYMNYAALGYVVAAMDCRGQGGKSKDLNPVAGNTYKGHIIRGLDDADLDNMYYRNVFLDTAMLARIVMSFDYVDETRVAAFGGSQGGALTVACAALTPNLKLALPQYPFLSDYKRVWDMDLDDRAYVELREYFRHYDPTHEHENEIFTKLGYIDLQHLADRIKAEIVMYTGLMDVVCPPSTQFAIYNKITSKKDVVIYPDFGHEGLKGQSDLVAQKVFETL